MRNDFAVFILTHGRANQQKTLETLKKCGYTGRLYLVIDDEDAQGPEYYRRYRGQVIEFSKKEIEKTFDTMSNAKEYRSVVYARNASYGLAKERGIRFILMLDDDITNLTFRVVRDNKLKGFGVHNIDRLFADMVEYMETANVSMLGFSQAGAFIGGASSQKYQDGCQRVLSQAMLVDVENPVVFRGIFNEDLHVSLDAGLAGKTALATMLVSITSPKRTTNKGGLHDLYVENSSYARDFYTVLAHPSVANITSNKQETTLRITRNGIAPMILNESFKKAVR